MLRTSLVVLVALVASACSRHASPSSRSPAVQERRAKPIAARRVAPAIVLRFESSTEIEIQGVPAAGARALDVHERGGAAALADVAGTHGVVVPLDTVIEGSKARAISVEPTPACPSPWLIDVSAELLATATSVRAAPQMLRAGCGPIQHADFITAFGRERVVVYGDAPFDVRMAASEMGIVRSDLEHMFEVRIEQRWLNEVVVAPAGDIATPVADAHPSGLRVHLDSSMPWGPDQRLEYAATIARIWVGKVFDHLAASGEPPAPERAALLHGVGRGIARESLFELGLLSPDDYAADLDRAEALVAERAKAWRPASSIDARDVAARAAAVSIEVALFAWVLREEHGLANVPRALRLVDAEGATDATVLWAELVAGAKPRRLGACIIARPTKTSVVDLGVLTPWDPTRGVVLVAALREGGSAERAGVRVGDELVRITNGPNGAAVSVRRSSRLVQLVATPRADVVARRGWVRRSDVADERCYPR